MCLTKNLAFYSTHKNIVRQKLNCKGKNRNQVTTCHFRMSQICKRRVKFTFFAFAFAFVDFVSGDL